VRPAVIYGIFGVANAALLFLTNIMLVRMIEPSSYGKINIALSYLAVMIPLISFNALGIVGIKRAVLNESEFLVFNTVYRKFIYFGTVVILITSVAISVYFDSVGYLTFILPAYIFCVAVTDYSSAILIQDGRPIVFGFAQMLSRALGIACIYVLINFGCDGLISYFLGLTVGEVTSIIFRSVKGQLRFFEKINCTTIELRSASKEIIFYGLTLLPLLFFGWSFNGLDKIVIGKNEGMTSVAIYSFAMTLAQSFSIINSAIINVKMPEIYNKLAKNSLYSIKYGRFLLIFLLIAGLLMPLAYLVMSFAIPKINIEYEGSIEIAIILIISVIFNGAYRLVISITDFYKKNLHKTILTIFASTFAFILMVTFADTGGITAVALSVLAGNVFLFCGALLLANSFIKIRQ
jgi:O-antigen/teichoic acid export membrane protein